MKRALFSMLSLLMIFAVAGCSRNAAEREAIQDLPIYNVGGEPIYAFPIDDLATLEKTAEVIVRGHLLDDAEEFTNEGDFMTYTLTTSTLKITQVYKGDFKVGDKLKLAEGYHIGERDGKKAVLSVHENYGPSIVGDEYIWFLGMDDYKDSPWYGLYFSLMGIKGRYKVVEWNEESFVAKFSNKELNLGNELAGGYRSIFVEVAEKYMRENAELSSKP